MDCFSVRKTKDLLIISILFLSSSCGDGANFGGDAARKESANVTRDALPPPEKPEKPQEEPTPDVVSIPRYQAMSWLWQCQNTPTPIPAPSSEEEVIVSGKGPFEFNEESLRGTKVTFSGRLCPPDSQARDIVFVVDTSLSMEDNDPLVGESCGRLKAVQAVVASIPAGIGQFAIVTFNSATALVSTKLYDNGPALFGSIAAGRPLSDVLCLADGTTNYDAGLTPATQLLTTGRPSATKEIYFISDGKPNGGDGIAIATGLKGTGVSVGGKNIPVTLGTIMLVSQEDDAALRVLASIDRNGKVLHAFVAQAQDLIKALTDLVKNEIVSASLKYRAIGETTFTTVNILDHLKGLDFTLPPMEFPIKSGVPGLEVVYEYMDKLGQKFSTTGRVLLKVTTSATP